MSTTLIIFLDDCPRTHRFLKRDYCKETKCLYHDRRSIMNDQVKRQCTHPRIFINEKERHARLAMLETKRAETKEKNVYIPPKKRSISNR